MQTKNFQVKWWHHNNQGRKTPGKMGHKPTLKKSFTDCEITHTSAGILGIGTAYLNPEDNYDKAKGRYYAFKSALNSFVFSKEDKKELWDAFIEYSPKSFKRK